MGRTPLGFLPKSRVTVALLPRLVYNQLQPGYGAGFSCLSPIEPVLTPGRIRSSGMQPPGPPDRETNGTT